MRVRLRRNFNTGQYRYKKNMNEGIEFPNVTEIPSNEIPSDALVLVGDKWEVNNPEKAGKVEKQLTMPTPILGPKEMVAQQTNLLTLQQHNADLERENARLRGQLDGKRAIGDTPEASRSAFAAAPPKTPAPVIEPPVNREGTAIKDEKKKSDKL